MARLVNISERPFGLLLCNYNINQGAVVAESVNAFLDYSRYPYFVYSSNSGFSEEFDFDDFDFLVIHYSIIPSLPGFLRRGVAERIRRFKGLKIQMIQDDYRMNQLLVRFIRECGIDVVYTVAPPAAAKTLYSDQIPGLDVETYLTGYVSNWLKLEKPLPLKRRKYYVGYRGRKYPYWFGEPVIAKIDVANDFGKKLGAAGLRYSFSTREKDRVYGRAWIDFLRSCRAVFGVETDVQYIDPHGFLYQWYDTLEKLSDEEQWDGKSTLSNSFFKEHAQAVSAPLAVIPPRIFETIAVRSANVLVEGRYSDVIKPWRHYIPIDKDMAQADDVIRALRDEKLLINMISVAFAEIAQKREFTYEGFADQFDKTLDRHLKSERYSRPGLAHSVAEAKADGDKSVTSKDRIGNRNEIHLEALNKIAPFYQLTNPNAYSVENPERRGPIRKALRALMSRVRNVLRMMRR